MGLFALASAGRSGLRRVGLLAAGIAAVAAVSCALATPGAGAAAPLFWNHCPGGTAAGQCRISRGVVADPTNGHVFVADQDNARIDEFSAWGQFLKAWGWGVDDGSTALQTCTEASGCQAGSSGAGVGQLNAPQGVARDSVGNLYVVDFFNRRVQKFDPEGHFLLMFGKGVDQGPNHPGDVCTAAFIAEGDTCGGGTKGEAGHGEFFWFIGSFIAVDTKTTATATDDVVYVGGKNRIQLFNTAGQYQSEIALPERTVESLAVDASGNLYAGFKGLEGVHKLSPGGVEECEMEVGKPLAVATGPASGVYVADNLNFGDEEILKFDSASCDEVENFEFPFSLAELTAAEEDFSSTGIAAGAVNEDGGVHVYLTNSAEPYFLRAYGAAEPDPGLVGLPPAVPPTITAQFADSVSTEGAVLRALINPHFWSGGIGETDYYLQYGTAACVEAGWEEPCVHRQPEPPGSKLLAPSVDSPVATSNVVLTGLDPNTTYRFRFVAQSDGGGPVKGVGGTEAVDGSSSTFTTADTPLASPSCPNDAFRGGPAAHLPDCRAYEMVSPLDKNGGDIQALRPAASSASRYTSFKQAAEDGERVTYSSATAFGDAQAGPYSNQYISNRGAAGWSTHGISPPRGTVLFEGEPTLVNGYWELETLFEAFTPDLCSGWFRDTNVTPLTSDGLEGYVNLYRRNDCGGASGFEALTNEGPFFAPLPTKYLNGLDLLHNERSGLRFQGYSSDLSHMLFIAAAPLSEDSATGVKNQLYDLHAGKLELVSVLPNGDPDPNDSYAGTFEGPSVNRESNIDHAISADGSRIFWTSNASGFSGPGKIYARIDGEETIPVAESTSRFWTAAADGSAVLFTTGEDLYEFGVDKALAEEPEPTRLIAHQVSGVAGAADDLSRIYFVSREALVPGALAGEQNLYLDQNGVKRLVAVLSDSDSPNLARTTVGAQNPIFRTSRVTPDGRSIAFEAVSRLTGYDNFEPIAGKPFAEVYRYGSEGQGLTCVSCSPAGLRPTGIPAILEPYTSEDVTINKEFGTAARLPTWEREQYASRALSDDGSRLFFESYEALVPRDTNGAQDVYEWEQSNSRKGCEALGAELYSSDSGGCLSLISTGTSPQKSEFIDASASGKDVFISTTSSINPHDEGLIDIYDARVGGGFPEPPPPPPCVGDACQSVPNPPQRPSLASANFQGPGSPEKRGADCGADAKRAANLSRRAKRLRSRAGEAGDPSRAEQMRRQAQRLSKRAHGLDRNAKRCRRANRGGSK